MKDALTSLRMQKRKVDKRVTNENKKQIINAINKDAKDLGYGKLSKDASIQEVTRFKNAYVERLTYDIVSLAVNQGKDIVAEVEARELRKSNDLETKRLGDFGKQLAKAKKESDSKLNNEEKTFLERGNLSIKGYGNNDMVSLFENTKNGKEVQALIEKVKEQDPKKIFYDKEIELFKRTFQKVGIVRENDLNKLEEKLRSLDMKDLTSQTYDLLKTIEVFDYEKFSKESVDETEIANARLDDVLIKTGLKKSGKKKVDNVYKKYQSKYNKNSGFIY